jgi:hypothetical protein
LSKGSVNISQPKNLSKNARQKIVEQFSHVMHHWV